MLLDPLGLSDPRLSAVDAFFLAYQRQARIPMHLGVTLRLRGALGPGPLLAALAAVRLRWPGAGRLLEISTLGLRWGEPSPPERSLVELGPAHPEDFPLDDPLDPTRTAPFQILWRPGDEEHELTLRAHHALLDGEGFLLAAFHLLDALAAATAGAPPPPAEEHAPAQRRRPSPPLLNGRSIQPGERCFLPLASAEPGPCGRAQVVRGAGLLGRLEALERRSGVGPPWWALGAWLKALERWRRGHRGPGRLTLEVPASLRGSLAEPLRQGNHVAPLILEVDAAQPLEGVARALKAAFKGEMASGAHRRAALLAAPGKWLPWPVFRRIAVTSERTGNATSHGVYLRLRHEPEERVRRLSGGRLALVGWAPFTPVCLRMGAALTALQGPTSLRLAVTYRRGALGEERAAALLEQTAEALEAAAR